MQHIAEEFWSCGQKEFLESLQTWQKWNIGIAKVLLKEDIGNGTNWHKWPVARIVSTDPDFCGMVLSQWKVIDISITSSFFDGQSVRLCCFWKMNIV